MCLGTRTVRDVPFYVVPIPTRPSIPSIHATTSEIIASRTKIILLQRTQRTLHFTPKYYRAEKKILK